MSADSIIIALEAACEAKANICPTAEASYARLLAALEAARQIAEDFDADVRRYGLPAVSI